MIFPSLGLDACDLKISGGDEVMSNESGGIDGTYEVVGCHDGKPMYKRAGSGKGRSFVCFIPSPTCTHICG